MESRVSVKRLTLSDLQVQILPPTTRRAFLSCMQWDWLPRGQWYLAGGTALALWVGHRQSVGLDFFTPRKSFKKNSLEHQLMASGDWQTTLGEDSTIYGRYKDAKMSFIGYPFFKPSPAKYYIGKIWLLAPEDIAAMKIVAVSQRGTKRDFVDLFWYCNNKEPLVAIIRRAVEQYPGQEDNVPHFLKSLTYFADAEQDPMPKVYFKADWRTIKSYFRREVLKVTREILGMK